VNILYYIQGPSDLTTTTGRSEECDFHNRQIKCVNISCIFLNKKAWLSVFLVASFTFKALAQHESDYGVYANIIYRFTKYINWPDNLKTGDFVIGIIGDSPLFDELKKIAASKTVGNQKIVIKKLSVSVALSGCHMLFISEEESNSLKKIVTQNTRAPVLVITEADGLAHKGSCINFTISDEHLKLEINQTNIEQRNLQVASELLGLGVVVK
jgi:hypothetical protein